MVVPAYRMPSYAISDYDPLATNEENLMAVARAEQRGGYFTGPGWAPTWHGDERTPQQGYGAD